MAYVTCPGCQVPQMVGDDLIAYQCFTCFMDVRFHKCPHCGLPQAVLARWRSYTCGRCQRKVDRPHRESYPESTKAGHSEGVGYPYPKL